MTIRYKLSCETCPNLVPKALFPTPTGNEKALEDKSAKNVRGLGRGWQDLPSRAHWQGADD